MSSGIGRIEESELRWISNYWLSEIESLLKSKQEEIEHQIYLKRNVFGLGGGSDTEEQDKKNAENVIRMNAYNQSLDDIKPIINKILK